MTTMTIEAQTAIAESIERDRIVTIREPAGSDDWRAVCDALSGWADGSAEYAIDDGEMSEYWGTDESDNDWRVHVIGERQ